MVDLVITPASVTAAASAKKTSGTAGATITAGQVVYLDTTDSRLKLADADAAGVGSIPAFYIALNGASNGQPLAVISEGDLTLGAVMTAGTSYYLSPTAGGIAPHADILSGDNVVFLGVAKSTSVLAVKPIISGVTL